MAARPGGLVAIVGIGLKPRILVCTLGKGANFSQPNAKNCNLVAISSQKFKGLLRSVGCEKNLVSTFVARPSLKIEMQRMSTMLKSIHDATCA